MSKVKHVILFAKEIKDKFKAVLIYANNEVERLSLERYHIKYWTDQGADVTDLTANDPNPVPIKDVPESKFTRQDNTSSIAVSPVITENIKQTVTMSEPDINSTVPDTPKKKSIQINVSDTTTSTDK